MKSQAFCVLMANKAGKAKLGSILPLPISTPINVPITCAITAPGPNSGERIGKEQMNPMTIKPQTLPANGIIIFANRLPIPLPWMIPISIATKAMNGMIVCKTVCTASRADCSMIAIPLPAAKPIFATTLPFSAFCCVNFLSVV